MNLDKNGLPVQADGDANDQLQRVSMILTADRLNRENPIEAEFFAELFLALHCNLQPKPGVYVRHMDDAPNNVSGDQLISAMAAWIAMRETLQALYLGLRMLARAGFAQNTRDMYGRTAWKVPDFILLRALPLLCRSHWSLYPLALFADSVLVLSALTCALPVWKDDEGFAKRSPDDVDDNLAVMTFAVRSAVMPTPLSWLAAKIYAKLRPWNYGCSAVAIEGVPYDNGKTIVPTLYDHNAYSPVYGALRWYHRAENGGNPEIAEMWKPIVERYLS